MFAVVLGYNALPRGKNTSRKFQRGKLLKRKNPIHFKVQNNTENARHKPLW
jgi:hypothetical protein